MISIGVDRDAATRNVSGTTTVNTTMLAELLRTYPVENVIAAMDAEAAKLPGVIRKLATELGALK